MQVLTAPKNRGQVPNLFPLARADDPGDSDALSSLASRLADFYAHNSSYFDQAAASDQSRFYDSLRPHLVRLAQKHAPRRLRMVELGAGRTGFPKWLTRVGLRDAVECVAQDITSLNRDWLDEHCDAVLVGDAADGIPGGPYDVVFSTFVYEHFVRPHRVLEASLAALRSGGLMAIFSPLYVCPGYVPPALRALPSLKGLAATLYLAWQNFFATWRRRPNFWIATDPALLKLGYFIDSDAVHLVSSADLHVSLAGRATRIPLNLPAHGLRDWIWSRFLLLAALYRKR